MKNILLILSLSLALISCKITKETYVLHEYPIDYYEEIVIPSEHLHMQDTMGRWQCVYYESDTICWHVTDTIKVYSLLKVEKVKRFALK